jgi:predicted short-subunit dehydrogenase-like oxidoreductase (DUF2520 family)
MRELERDLSSDLPPCPRLAVIGRGRLGSAITAALSARPGEVALLSPTPLGRDSAPAALETADAILLCVPDGQIAAAAARLPRGRLVGHCSGATGLDVLAPHEGFGLHPLMSVTARRAPRFAGAGAAIAGTTPRARRLAERLALALELRPVEVSDDARAAYHAAASIASNFLVTLEAAAEQLAATAGVGRELLVPLVQATVENWAALGGEQALTGPVARGDELTVARQRAAVSERAPELLALFDALVERTRALAAGAAARAGTGQAA